MPKPAKGSGAALALAARRALRLPTDGRIVIACRWPSHAAFLYASKRGSVLIGLGGDEHLERKLGQRARRHDEQPLALDKVFDSAEQIAIKRMRGGGIERRNLLFRYLDAKQGLASLAVFFPSRQLLLSRPQRKAATRSPSALGAEAGMLVQRASFLVSAKTSVSSGTFASARDQGTTRELRLHRAALALLQWKAASGLPAWHNQGSFGAARLGSPRALPRSQQWPRAPLPIFGMGFTRRRIEAAIGSLARACQILLLAHKLARALAALGKTRGHSGKRIGRIVLQRPLRQPRNPPHDLRHRSRPHGKARAHKRANSPRVLSKNAFASPSRAGIALAWAPIMIGLAFL